MHSAPWQRSHCMYCSVVNLVSKCRIYDNAAQLTRPPSHCSTPPPLLQRPLLRRHPSVLAPVRAPKEV